MFNKLINRLPDIKTLSKLFLLENLPRLSNQLSCSNFLAACKVTENCNSKCEYCNFHKTVKKEMDFEQWVSIINQFKNNNIKYVRFTGGEPFMNPNILDLLQYSKNIGLQVSLQSNVLLLDEFKIMKLKEIGINSLSISIDGTDDDYKDNRGVDGFSRVKKICEILSRELNGIVQITPTITDTTIKGLYKVIKFAEEVKIPVTGFSAVNMTHYFFKGDYNENAYKSLDREESDIFLRYLFDNYIKKHSEYCKISRLQLYTIKKYFDDFHMSDLPCIKPFYQICIGSTGNVYGCCSMNSIGNLNNNTLTQIMQSSNLKDVRHHALNKTCPGCSCGMNFNSKFNLKYNIDSLRYFK